MVNIEKGKKWRAYSAINIESNLLDASTFVYTGFSLSLYQMYKWFYFPEEKVRREQIISIHVWPRAQSCCVQDLGGESTGIEFLSGDFTEQHSPAFAPVLQ